MYKLPTKKIFWLRTITAVIVFFALISMFVASFNICYIRTPVKGLSMYPTLNYTTGEDIVYINRFANVKKNDIVVLDLTKHPEFQNYSIKRLIATEGDIVKIKLNIDELVFDLVVNNNVIYSKHYDNGFNTYNSLNTYISNHQLDSSRIIKDEQGDDCVIVKQGEIFILGDNWNVSIDSSLVGPISSKTIVGRVDIISTPNQSELLQILKRIF